MENVTIFGPISKKQKRDLESFAKKDGKKPEDLARIAVDQYLKWREDPENHSCCYKPLRNFYSSNAAIFIPSSLETYDKLRGLANKEKLTILHLVQHALHLYLEKRSSPGTACPHCGSEDYEVRNHNLDWHDGDVYCKKCGTYIRMFDAG